LKIAIIGNGIAGTTAARTIRKLRPDWPITIISAETDYLFSRTALMYIYMGHLTYKDTKPYEDWFWTKNRIDLVRGFVDRIDTTGRELNLADGRRISYDKLILATGSRYNRFDWPGQDLPGVQGLVTYQDLELLEENTRGVEHGVVVGGGLIGIELAEMLRSRRIGVSLLVREAAYMDYLFPAEESELIHKQIQAHGVDLRLGTELSEVIEGPDGRVGAVRTSTGETIPCGMVGLTAGVSPNTTLATESGVETTHGILVDRRFQTSVDGIYAVGDCAEFRDPLPGREPVEQLWYTGGKHGKTVGTTIAGESTEYDPGVFYNSAKFFDLEYQTYGDVPATTPEDHESVLWSDGLNKLVRVNYRQLDSAVVGFNALGVRLRQDVCADWINTEAKIDKVLAEFRRANFDPEFSKRYQVQSTKYQVPGR